MGKPFRIDPYGPNALLVRFASQGDDEAFGRAQALWRYLEEHPPAGLLEATPGFTTLMLEYEAGCRPRIDLLTVVLQRVVREAPSRPPLPKPVELPVIYDGPDLERVAAGARLGVAEVVRRHSAVVYRVHLLGFAPGFAYLGGLDSRLHTPRMATPRPRVPAGSVAIGGEHTGIYPVSTAGGWNLIGRTNARLVDPDQARAGRVEAFLLRPGDAVRFVAVESF